MGKYSDDPQVDATVVALADEYAAARDNFKANPDDAELKAVYEAAAVAFDNARSATYSSGMSITAEGE